MANLVIGCLAAFFLGICGVQGLNPNFDKETLGLQFTLTQWKVDSSVHDLVTELGNQIPMNVSADCKLAMHDWMYDAMRKEEYALKMIDAFGKPPAGAKLGHILIFGHFDQCLGIQRVNQTTNISEPMANYCMARLDHPAARALPALPAYGVCLPLACANGHDTNAFITGLFGVLNAAKDLKAVKGICVTPMAKNAGFYIMVILIALIIVVMIAACVIDCVYRRRFKESPNGYLATDANDIPVHIYETHKTVNGNGLTISTSQHVETQELTRKPKFGYANVPAFLKPLLCYNVMTNLRSILSSGVTEGEISFLHGFRVLSMWWIILGHTYYLGRNFFENSLMFFQDIKTTAFQIVLNAGYAVDSFFLLSGLLITYVLYRDLVKREGRMNWVLVYFHRWWRLTPVYVFVMLFYVYVLPHGIKSPFKLLIAQEGNPTDYCKSHWWTNMLYINNFYPLYKNRQCMNWTWFLALDMQFFVITPIILLVLYKSRNVGFAIIGVIVAACIATTMGLIGRYGLPIHFWQDAIRSANETANEAVYHKDIDYIYEKPYTRITPFVIGILLGYLFATRPADKVVGRGHCLKGVIGWTLSTAIACFLLFGFYFVGWYDERPPQEMSLAGRVMYGGLQRFGWSLVVGWVLFACQYGYAGPVRRFLGARFWRPLSNLTYGAYLVHMLTLQLYFASQRHMIFYSPLNMVTIYLAQLFLAYAVALVIAVLVEVPLLRLERLIVRRSL